MRQYIMNVIGVAILAGLADQLISEKGRLREHVRLLLGLCLILVMLAPLGSALSSLPTQLENGMAALEDASGGGEYDKILEGTLKEAVRQELVAALTEELEQEFGVNADTVRIGISFEEGEPIRLRRVLVTLTGRDVFRDPYTIEKSVSALLGCECVVVVG